MNETNAEQFEELRGKLVLHAYRMLGEYSEAEDVVQEAYIRWNEALEHTPIRDDRAYLRAAVTRLCIDRLRSARARREVYVGPWLPEPIVTDSTNDPQASAALADEVSFALMLALERLSPLERAAFLLHDVLDVPFGEIAKTLGRTESAVRQLASRGRDHVRDSNAKPRASREEALRLRDALSTALMNDDLEALQRLLTQDVVFTSDGGGKASAALVPVIGPDHVGRFLIGVTRKGKDLIRSIEYVTLNGLPGFVVLGDEGVLQAAMFDVAEGGKISAIYAMRNPDKLRALEARFGFPR